VVNPKTLTTAAMDERFECVQCVHLSQRRLVMKWRIAVISKFRDCGANIEVSYICMSSCGEILMAASWQLLDPDEVIAAKA
jgi:hypothetical protein